MWPKKETHDWLETHLSKFKVSPVCWIALWAALSLLSRSLWSQPITNICIINMAGRSARMLLIRLWKCLGALEIPKGSLLKQNLPNGVRNIVRSLESGSRGICQKPLFVWSFEKNFPVSWGKAVSILGRGWTSLKTLSFRNFKSRHILTSPELLGTTTMPAHQGVDVSTFEMTSNFSIRFSSFLTLDLKGIGICLGVNKA